MSSIAKIKANNTEYDVVGLGVENVKNDSFIGTWQGTQQEWEQADSADWKNWKTAMSVSNYTSQGVYGYAIGYHDGLWVAGYGASGGSTLLYKEGSGSWTSCTVTGSKPHYWLQISYFKDKWIAIGRNSNNTSRYLATSTDGKNWVSDTATSLSTVGERNHHILCNDNIAILGSSDNTFYYSSNGTDWTSSTFTNLGNTKFAYGNGKFAAIGISGGYAYFGYSDDGISWSESSRKTYPAFAADIAYGNGIFVALVNGSNKYHVSTDGENWTIDVSNLPTLGNFILDFIGGYFVVVNSDGHVYTSVDGVSWTDNGEKTVQQNMCQIAHDETNSFIYTLQTANWAMYQNSLSFSSCYTLDTVPTTASTVYSAPNTESALTVTTGGSASIVLSDNQTYNRNAAGDTTTYQTAGSLYPNHLAFVDNVGVKIGNTLIANSTDISGKADKDLSNLSTAGKAVISNLPMPSTTSTAMTVGASDTSYTAPADGWFNASMSSSGSTGVSYVTLLTTSGVGSRDSTYHPSSSAAYGNRCHVPVRKGQTVRYVYAGMNTISSNILTFYYAEGEK